MVEGTSIILYSHFQPGSLGLENLENLPGVTQLVKD